MCCIRGRSCAVCARKICTVCVSSWCLGAPAIRTFVFFLPCSKQPQAYAIIVYPYCGTALAIVHDEKSTRRHPLGDQLRWTNRHQRAREDPIFGCYRTKQIDRRGAYLAPSRWVDMSHTYSATTYCSRTQLFNNNSGQASGRWGRSLSVHGAVYPAEALGHDEALVQSSWKTTA